MLTAGQAKRFEIELQGFMSTSRAGLMLLKAPSKTEGDKRIGTVGIAREITVRKFLEHKVPETLRRGEVYDMMEMLDRPPSRYRMGFLEQVVMHAAHIFQLIEPS